MREREDERKDERKDEKKDGEIDYRWCVAVRRRPCCVVVSAAVEFCRVVTHCPFGVTIVCSAFMCGLMKGGRWLVGLVG